MPVKRCKCEHKWMDGRYGKGQRIHNEVKGQSGITYRCVVCGAENGSNLARKGKR